MHRRASIIAALLLAASSAQALVVEPALPDRQQEQAAQQLFHDMKCVVCEGQSLAESDAAFAQQMRGHIRRMIAKGNTPQQVRDYFAQRYGDQILLTPPLAPRTALLWAAPLLLVLGGGVMLWRTLRRGGASS